MRQEEEEGESFEDLEDVGRPYKFSLDDESSYPDQDDDEMITAVNIMEDNEQQTKIRNNNNDDDEEDDERHLAVRWSDECGYELEDVVLDPSRGSPHSRAARSSSSCGTPLSCKHQQSNARLLGTAFCTVMSFAIFQMAFAVHAQSQSLIGDYTIMIVDSLTYLFNWVVEVRKGRDDAETLLLQKHNNKNNTSTTTADAMDPEELPAIQKRTKRKLVLQMEIFPTIVSMLLLVFKADVAAMHQQAGAVGGDGDGDDDDINGPNVQIMAVFSIFNLFLYVINFTCFAHARHLLGFPTPPPSDTASSSSSSYRSSSSSTEADSDANVDGDEAGKGNRKAQPWKNATSSTTASLDNMGNYEDEEEKQPEESNIELGEDLLVDLEHQQPFSFGSEPTCPPMRPPAAKAIIIMKKTTMPASTSRKRKRKYTVRPT